MYGKFDLRKRRKDRTSAHHYYLRPDGGCDERREVNYVNQYLWIYYYTWMWDWGFQLVEFDYNGFVIVRLELYC